MIHNNKKKMRTKKINLSLFHLKITKIKKWIKKKISSILYKKIDLILFLD